MRKQLLTFFSICLFFIAFSTQAQNFGEKGALCNNGIDDDGDGLIDCADTDEDCHKLPVCRLEGLINGLYYNCGDGIDNDGVGGTDCMDPKCLGALLCPVETNCGNGVDDDGDGFIDYYDGDCLDDPSNPNDYIVTKPDCEKQPVGNTFDIAKAWDSEVHSSAVYGMPSVADIDNDDIPEVISANEKTNELYLINGQDGTTKKKIKVSNNPVFAYPAVADVDGDGYGEIFIFDRSGNLYAYEHDLTPISAWGGSKKSPLNEGRVLGIADFNQDGNAEIYYVNEIRDAKTGSLIVAGTGDWTNNMAGIPVAVDILPKSASCLDCDGLELVLGNIIYAVDIPGKKITVAMNMDNATTKTITNPYGTFSYQSTDKYKPKKTQFGNENYSATSVVDLNQDGNLDVVLSGTLNNSASGPSMIFFWDIANDAVKAFLVTRPANTIAGGSYADIYGGGCTNADGICTWIRGTGALNIANIDKDADLEITFMSGSSLYALDKDLNLEWANHDSFWEVSSGFTGTAVFDFDGDGASEIIYRDEVNLYIVDGTTGIPLNDENGYLSGTYCSSQTQAEYPIVADVDGDGETEIVVSCSVVQNTHGDPSATGANSERPRGFIRAYKAANNNYWVPAREVWNQFTYFNVNINDNLSVPKVQQPHHKNFSQICNDPTAPQSFSLNKFLNQSPRISYCGQLVFPSPKLDFADDGVIISPPVCPDREFEVKLIFQNNGDAAVNGPIPISFYADDPQKPYSNTETSPYLETINLTINGGLQKGQKVDTTLWVTGIRGAFTLYVSLNDIGQFDKNGNPMPNADFYPLDSLNGPVRECDDLPTIVSKPVNPYPFDIIATVISDNRNCPGAVGNNGEIQVLAADSTVLPSSEYKFIWTNLNTGQVISNDALVSELDSGTYRVEVVYDNGVYTCQGKADTVTVQRLEDWPNDEVVTIEKLKDVSSCRPGTADGEARVLINGTEPSDADYDIVWVDEQDPDEKILAVGATVAGLKQLLYKATITNKLTGCSDSESIDMTLDLPAMDAPTVTHASNCKNPNGSITAKMTSGSKSSYGFILIKHSPVQDTITSHNNGSFSGLEAGMYEIRAYDPASECGLYTEGILVEVENQKSLDDATTSVIKEQTACEAPYNGQLSVTVNSSGNFEYVWYRGFEAPANVVAQTATTPDTLSTNITDLYVVVITNKGTGCTTKEEIQLTENIQKPTVNVNVTSHQTFCIPNGSITATASPAGPAYAYYLYQGSNLLATNGTGTFTNLEAGPYVLEVKNLGTGCVSNPSGIIQIQENTVPFGTVNVTETPVTNCNPTALNGVLSVDVNGSTAGYTFKWFEGTDTLTAVSPQPATPYQLTNVPAGEYMVKITNTTTSCENVTPATLTDISMDYRDVITVSVLQHQINCTGTKSGALEAGLIQSTSGPAPDPADYTFYWYTGRKSDVKNNAASLISGENGMTISGLDAGWYSVRAVRTDGSGCHALDTAEVRIRDDRNYPITNINVTIVQQTSCDSNNPNGSLSGDVGGNTADYIFTWYQLIGGNKTDISVNNPNAVFTDNTVSNIGGDQSYVLEVRHKTTGCADDKTVWLPDNQFEGDEIKLNLAATQATDCVNPNGSVEVTQIQLSEDGGSTYTLTDAIGNYAYQWFEGNDTSTPIDPAANPSASTNKLENVGPGEYTVLATNINSNCVAIAYTATVEGPNNITVTFTTDQPQSSCASPDGQLTAVVSGGTPPYTYQWYLGPNTSIPIPGEDNLTISNLAANWYSFEVIDASGCSTFFTDTLSDVGIQPLPPGNFDIVKVNSENCDPLNPTGELHGEIRPGLLQPGAAFDGYAADDFVYYWFEGENMKFKSPMPYPGDLNHPDNLAADYGLTSSILGLTHAQATATADITGLAPGFYSLVILDVKDFIANGSGDINDLGCRSRVETFTIDKVAKKPIAVFTTQMDTLCVGASGSATITAGKRSGDTTPFNEYEITAATKAGSSLTLGDFTIGKVSDPGLEQTTFSVTNLDEGEYAFTIQDLQTLCDTLIRVNIDSQEEPPTLLYTDVQVNQHQTICNPSNGELEVINAPGSVGNLADYNFYWYNELSDYDSNDPAGSASQTGTVYSGLDSGWYYVFAQDIVTGCISSYRAIEIKFQVTEMVVDIATQHNTNCDPATPNGEISVNAHEEDENGAVSMPVGGYDFTWYKDGVLLGNDNGVLVSSMSNLEAGAYRIDIYNTDLDCPVKTVYNSVEFQPIRPSFTVNSVGVQHIEDCQTPGSITIEEIRENGVVITSANPAFANYAFEWRQGDINNPPLAGETSNTLSNLSADTYFVYVINTTTGNCISNTYRQIILEDNSEAPLVYKQEIVDFISCTGMNEGAIEVYAGEFTGITPVGGYTFTWSYADGTVLPGTEIINNSATDSRISNLDAGDYRVIALNNDTQCADSAYYTVGERIYHPILTVRKIQDQTYCYGNGAANVEEITLMGVAQSLNDYNIVWFEADGVTPFGAPTYGLSMDSLSADSLTQGTYFVKAVNPMTGCESFPRQVVIDDVSIPLIVLPDGIPQPVIGCDPSVRAEGELSISVRNSSTFITRWYGGNTINNVADSIPFSGNQTEISNLIPGFYTVYVEDTLTGCSTTRVYEIEGIAVPLTVTLSSTPFGSCILPDGKIAVNVNGGSGEYQFTWYAGQDINATPISVTENTLLENLTDGLYTVVVQDLIESACHTQDAQVVVEDMRGKEIQINVFNDFPVTNCDENNPNGQLTASVEGDISRYNFFWYEGQDVSKKPIAKGVTAYNLAPDEYTVIARDKITGCLSGQFSQRVDFQQETDNLPDPVVQVISHVTHCTIPNGSAIAILDSTSINPDADYRYIWTDSIDNEVFSSTRTNIITGVAPGNYNVMVFNVNTGCYIGFGSVIIQDSIYRPEFDIVTTPSNCLEPSGTISLEFTEPIQIVDIEWITPYEYATGFYLKNQPPGDYQVRITDANGCILTKKATIGTSLYVYNGVSPNGDNKNDKFIISCINNMEQKSVRIYNRAGALVYENNNYDNETNYFDGIGNRGLYIGGEKLPDGTYFYLIDQHNGEKPLSGYLELLR